MYGRRRGGGRGYRNNNPIGMGTVAARSVDGPVRGGVYNSGNRNFNRGFGRGQGRYFQSPQPFRKGDLFMEAGRLAAEYLVAKGMLPANALPPKFQNGGFRQEVGEFRQQDAEYMQLDSRTSALTRLGSFDGVSDRKRYPNDYSAAGSKHNSRGKRETGSFSNYDSDWGQETGKSGSISGRSRASSDKEADDDALSVHRDEQLTTKDDEQNLKVVELASKSNANGDSPSEPAADTHQLVTDSFITDKDGEQLTNMDGEKESDGFGNINVEAEEMKESKNDEVTGQQSTTEDSVIQPDQVAATPSQKGNELLQLCNFAKFPTRSRSLRSRGSKSNLNTNVEEENNSAGTSTDVVVPKSVDNDVTDRSLVDTPMEQKPFIEEHTSAGTPVDPEILSGDDAVGLSESNATLEQNLDLTTTNIMSMDKSKQSSGKGILLDPDDSTEGSKCLESLSFLNRSFGYPDESRQRPQGSNGPVSVDKFAASERGEKRILDDFDIGGTFKKLKVWHPSMISQVNEYPHISNLSTEGPTMIGRMSPMNNLMMIGQESSGFTTLGDENSIGYAEDKQMIDSSFKICDLNLMEGSHLDENQDGSQMMFFSSMSEIRKEPLSVDGGLTVGGSSNTSHKYSTIGDDANGLEIINLDSDLDEDRAFNPGEKREDTVYTGLESFPSQPRVTSDSTDVQDGYGLMISELLGNEIPNCSAVPRGINSLHDDMTLHHGQEMLPEDDSIYMALGEIPIGFWEPPNPDFGKPF